MSWLNRLPRRLTPRLMAGATLQMLLISAAVGALAYWSGRRGGLERAELERQQGRITLLSSQLSGRLTAPRLINAINQALIRQGQLNLNDFNELAGQFVAQMRSYPVGYINYGTIQGDFIGVERRDDGSFTINEDSHSPLGRGTLGIYAVTGRGQRGQLLEAIPFMSTFHEEAWYSETVKAGKPLWSSIYSWEERPEVFAISYNEPIYGSGGQLLGVIGVDFVLTQLSTWLKQVWRDQKGLALVVERNGMVVAASQPGLTRTGTPGRWRRARIDELTTPLARRMGLSYFQPDTKGNLRLRSPRMRPGEQIQEHDGYLLDAQTWGRAEGLNWILLTATSSDATVRTTRQLALVALMASLLTIGLALLITRSFTRWLLSPLLELQQRALQAAPQVENEPGRIHFDAQLAQDSTLEIEQLAQAFGELVERLNTQSSILMQQEERLEAKLRSSLHAAAVAHEINLPLSSMLLNTRLLLGQPTAGLNGEERALLEAMGHEAEQVVATIEKMRTLLRNVQTVHQPVDLAGVSRSALLQVRSSLHQADVVLNRDPSLQEPVRVQGDPAQIQIAIVNLLRNAIEALNQQPAGESPRLMAMALERNGDGIDLIVDDNGPGFPPGQRDVMPLETTKPRGSGLGLFVVETAMANHNGQVLLERSPWGGARVRLHFPCA